MHRLQSHQEPPILLKLSHQLPTLLKPSRQEPPTEKDEHDHLPVAQWQRKPDKQTTLVLLERDEPALPLRHARKLKDPEPNLGEMTNLLSILHLGESPWRLAWVSKYVLAFMLDKTFAHSQSRVRPLHLALLRLKSVSEW